MKTYERLDEIFETSGMPSMPLPYLPLELVVSAGDYQDKIYAATETPHLPLNLEWAEKYKNDIEVAIGAMDKLQEDIAFLYSLQVNVEIKTYDSWRKIKRSDSGYAEADLYCPSIWYRLSAHLMGGTPSPGEELLTEQIQLIKAQPIPQQLIIFKAYLLLLLENITNHIELLYSEI